MVVTTMAQTNSLVKKLRSNYSNFQFKEGDTFRWSPDKKTIYFPPDMSKQDEKILLHELAHALLDHTDYDKDIELIHKESEAWEYAAETLSKRHNVAISEDDIEETMNSYRDWLHKRSLCPECFSNAPQQPKNTYKCIACGCSWRANDARICELRRYKVITTT